MAKVQGGGTVRRRGSKYELRVRIPDGKGGSVRVSIYGASPQACYDKAKERTDKARKTGVVRPGKETLGQWIEHWKAEVLPGKSRLADGTRQQYGYLVEHLARSKAAAKPMRELTTADLESAIARCSLGDSGKWTLHTIANSLFKDAIKAEKINFNPMAGAERPRRSEDDSDEDTEAKAFMPAEVVAMEKALAALPRSGAQIAALFSFAVRSGLRRGELLGLRWSDVHLTVDEPYLNVRQQLTADGRLTSRLKTRNSKRRLPLNSEAVAVLKAHRKAETARQLRAREWEDCGLVFTARNGQPLDPRGVTRRVTATADDLGLSKTLHGARHSAASVWLAHGVPVTTVAAWLGDTLETLTRVYAWALPSEDHRHVESMTGAYSAG